MRLLLLLVNMINSDFFTLLFRNHITTNDHFLINTINLIWISIVVVNEKPEKENICSNICQLINVNTDIEYQISFVFFLIKRPK